MAPLDLYKKNGPESIEPIPRQSSETTLPLTDSSSSPTTAPLLIPAIMLWLGNTIVTLSKIPLQNYWHILVVILAGALSLGGLTLQRRFSRAFNRFCAKALFPYLLGASMAPNAALHSEGPFADLANAPIKIQGEIVTAPRFTWSRLSDSAAPPLRATLAKLTVAETQVAGKIILEWPSSTLLAGRGSRVAVLLTAGNGPIRKVAAGKDIQLISNPGLLGFLDQLRLTASQKLQPICDGWASALLLGERRLIPPWVLNDYRDTGLAHLLAISGLHVGMILALLQSLGRRLPPATQRHWQRFSLGLILLHALISGADAPAVRAAVTGIFFCWGLQKGRVLSFPQIAGLFIIAWCLVGRPPPDPGATISIAAIFALQLCRSQQVFISEIPPLSQRNSSSLAWLKGGYIAFFGAHAALIWWNPTICFAGPIFTLLMLPVVMLTILLASFTLLCSLSLTVVDLSGIWKLLTRLLTTIPAELNRLPGTPTILPPTGPLFWSLIFGSAVLILSGKLRPISHLGIPIILSFWIPLIPAESQLQIELLSRGQGQALLLSSGKVNLLFDAGDTSSWDGGYSRIRDALWKRKIKSVDALFLSHPHLDHQGAVPDLLTHGLVSSLWITNGYDSMEPGKHIVRIACKSGVKIRRLKSQQALQLADFRIEVISSGIPVAMKPTANDLSPLIFIEWKNQSILTTGDATAPILAGATLSGPIDHVLLPHHGAPTKGLVQWLLNLQPRHIWVARKPPLPRVTAAQLAEFSDLKVHFHGDRWVYRAKNHLPEILILNSELVFAMPTRRPAIKRWVRGLLR
ncbi:MAG: hypothetical protein CBC13_02295 [Planctomycetia bacterium TMED53]|nr:MAG: hypothetical protein CBC13_02295 [Planctomycetia bacterium TMED53]